MSTFCVWAPLANSIEVVCADGTEYPLSKNDRGQFSSEDVPPVLEAYRLRIDNGESYPDPWSHYQAEGVHGPSSRVHHEPPIDNLSQPVAPLEETVIYELHVGTFSKEGTFLGAIRHLDHLRDLGVTHIELMPIAAFPGNHGWGYDGVYLFAPHAAYGSCDDLKRLIREAHTRGLAVLLDVVFNHFGPDGNYLGLYAPYATDKYKTPWGQAVNLDGPHSDLVREMFIECALYWLKNFGFDGLRLDAVHALYDQSATHFLEELAHRVDELGQELRRKLVLIAECDLNDPRYVRSVADGGFGLDAHWCDDFHHALHAYFTGESHGYYVDYGGLGLVAKALRQGYVFDGSWSPHRQRYHGRPPERIKRTQLVAFSQNHDQIGNRETGDRLSALLSRPQLFQVAALTLLSPLVPLIFQGEEWGTQRPFLYFTDHQDPELAKNVTEGRRREFAAFHSGSEDSVDPQDPFSYQKSILDFEELKLPEHQEIYQWYKKLIALRSRLDHKREVEVHFDETARWLSYRCGDLVLICNFGDEDLTVPAQVKHGAVLLSYPEIGTFTRHLPPHSSVVYSYG